MELKPEKTAVRKRETVMERVLNKRAKVAIVVDVV